MHPSKGFTLIELMVVVVVIGILAAIGIANYTNMQTRARDASTKSNMHTFQFAAEDYATRNDGAYADDASVVANVLPGAPAGPAPWREARTPTACGVFSSNRSSAKPGPAPAPPPAP